MEENKYKSYRLTDGKIKLVVVDENGKIINKNPSKEELKLLQSERPDKRRRIYYNRTNTCDNIKEDGTKCENKLIPQDACREYDEKGEWVGRWLCRSCRDKYDRNTNPNNIANLLKLLRNRRTGNLDPNSSQAKGDLFEELTCTWRGVKNLNYEYDSFNVAIDHSRDSELGIIQTKGKLYDSYNQRWGFHCEREWNKEFDNLIFYCASEDGECIERIYIFPRKEIIRQTGITIYKYNSKWEPYNNGWYEKYRVKDEKILELVNNIWKDIIKYNNA